MTLPDPRIADILEGLRALHADLKLAGELQQELYSPEDGIMLLLVSLLREDGRETTEVPPEDWARLMGLLAPHGILPLLYYRVACSHSAIPMWAGEHLQAAYLSSRAHIFRQEKELTDLLGALARAGVEPLVLKGPALGRSLYSDPVFRPSGDIDLLVRREQVPAAREALLSLGFVLPLDNYAVSPSFYDQDTYLPATGSPFTVPVELHWEVQRYGRRHRQAPIGDLFEKAVPVSASGLTFRTLSPVHALLYAGSHMVLHHADEVRLIWVKDVALLAGSLNAQAWRDLRDESMRWQARISVEKALTMASLWFDVPGDLSFLGDWPEPSATEKTTYEGVLHDLHRVRTFLALRWPKDAPLSEKARLLRRLVFDPMGTGSARGSVTGLPGGINSHFRRWAGMARRL
ncbi:MAG: nucleotidyltransferase family protein [Methanomicrobiales archaeon]|nr:nucleotidyltransferase family protein [Methanomicrobiales archaeon]